MFTNSKFKKNTPITVINDCRDENAKGRLMARLASYFPYANLNFIGVANDIEAALCLVDILDAVEGRPSIIVINVAPRNKEGKKWENGTPFGELEINNTRIFSTIDGYVFSLLQKLINKKLTVRVYDIPKVLPFFEIPAVVAKRVVISQYRSFDFLPRLAYQRMAGKKFPFSEENNVKSLPYDLIVFVDIFGNLKTSIPYNPNFNPGDSLEVIIGTNSYRLTFYQTLKDVPDGEKAVIVGSSGFEESRLLEIVVQGASAYTAFGNPVVGTQIKISKIV